MEGKVVAGAAVEDSPISSSDFSLTEGGDDLDNRVDMSKPSRGCSEDFKSFDLFPYFRRYKRNFIILKRKSTKMKLVWMHRMTILHHWWNWLM
ncbi:hypothetical protein P8452_51406 [Trifolium repens]|nr:hypothetical protein P8452_51406 [Trifolium repens]